jgi:nucleoside-diphosphate-sugar epimerase
MARFTILGAAGFVGSALQADLEKAGHEVICPSRDAIPAGDCGHLIYCIGLTADFRTRPFDTMRAHIGHLTEILAASQFESFLYLSSTRVYQHLPPDALAREEMSLAANPNDPSDLYNLSKLAGESLCLSLPRPEIRVARLSNVYGFEPNSENFLPSLIREGIQTGWIALQTSAASEKDYIALEVVTAALEAICLKGKSRLFNVASGTNTVNSQILGLLGSLLHCRTKVAGHAKPSIFPRISNRRLTEECGVSPGSLLEALPSLVRRYQTHFEGTKA